ncbi:MAG: ABC transporter permease [Oscillospiraceae bacterium]|jgi:tungstate transport system permease protein|nr:ABC transporter permease [Oscillospiraceae bacterium]
MQTFQELWQLLTGPDGELRGIVYTTLRLCLTSTVLSAALGIPGGAALGLYRFPGRKFLVRICRTLMGLPPVLAGLAAFFLLSRSGPLGQYKLLYSVGAMVTAQIMLGVPIAAGLTQSVIASSAEAIRETAYGIGLRRCRLLGRTLHECRKSFVSIVCLTFGQCLSEVGAAQICGGNIAGKTRVMTTAIVLETNMGDFKMAGALGILLLLISFGIMALGAWGVRADE